jgi:putative transposase
MTNYRRNFVPGGCQFFIVDLAERKSRLLTDHVDFLRAACRYARARHQFTVEAIPTGWGGDVAIDTTAFGER